MRPRTKFGNIPTEMDGFKFPSRLEADLYRNLVLLERAGEIEYVLRQVPIHLAPGKTMRVDFGVHIAGKGLVWLDAKGAATPDWLTKQAWAEQKHGIKVRVVTRGDLKTGDWMKWLT